MRFLPQTKADWGRFALFPFKVYVLIAWPTTVVVAQAAGRAGRALPIEIVWLGYHLCFWTLIGGGLIQLARGRRNDAVSTSIFAFVALFFLVRPMLR